MSTTRTPTALERSLCVRGTMQFFTTGLYVPETLFNLRERQFALSRMRISVKFFTIVKALQPKAPDIR